MLALIAQNWRSVLGLALALALFCGLLYIKGIRADNARLVQENLAHLGTVTRLTEDLAANRKALETREAESRQLAQDHQAVLAELEKVYETDPKACDWSTGPIPDSVYQRLCQ